MDLAAGSSALDNAPTSGSIVKSQRVSVGFHKLFATASSSGTVDATVNFLGSGTLDNTVVNPPEVGPVEEVEKLCPELQFHILSQIEILEPRKVEGVDSGANDGIASHGTMGAWFVKDEIA